MLTFLILFRGAFSLTTSFFGAIFTSVAAIEAICTVAILAFLALAIGARMERAWGGFLLSIIVMAAVSFLKPYESFIEIFLSVVLALYATYHAKRLLNRIYNEYLRRNPAVKPPCWMHTVIRFI